jgi:hypothetical protein
MKRFFSGVDPGIEVRGRETISEARGLGAALMPPMGPGQCPGGGLWGRSSRKLLKFRDFIGIKACFSKTIFLSF